MSVCERERERERNMTERIQTINQKRYASENTQIILEMFYNDNEYKYLTIIKITIISL